MIKHSFSIDEEEISKLTYHCSVPYFSVFSPAVKLTNIKGNPVNGNHVIEAILADVNEVSAKTLAE